MDNQGFVLTRPYWSLEPDHRRRGKKCAAVALANKTVRTAHAMLTQGTEYKAVLLAV